MSEPLGRPSIKVTLERLKAFTSVKNAEYNSIHEFLKNYIKDEMESVKSKKEDGLEEGESVEKLKELLSSLLKNIDLSAVELYRDTAHDFINTLLLYCNTLESYLSELDSTFDELLDTANKKAEEQIKEIPERPLPKFYGV